MEIKTDLSSAELPNRIQERNKSLTYSPRGGGVSNFPADLRPDVRLEKVPLKFFFPSPDRFFLKKERQNKTKKSLLEVKEKKNRNRMWREKNEEKKN